MFLKVSKNGANKLSKQRNIIGKDLEKYLQNVISQINFILENKDKSLRLSLSEVKQIKKQINRLIEKAKKLFTQVESIEEKEKIIEKILASIDYLFAKVDARKLFIRYPNKNIENLKDIPIDSQVLRLMLPNKYNIKNLEAINWWNCYLMWVNLYHSILKVIVWNDKDIKFNFHIDSYGNHWTLSINDKFFIDSDIKRFFNLTWKKQEKTNFYKIENWEDIKQLLNKLTVFETFNSLDEFIKYISNISKDNIEANFILWWEYNLRLLIWKKGNKLFCVFFNKWKWTKLSIKLNLENKNTKNKEIKIDFIIRYLIQKLANTKNDREMLEMIFSKIDKKVLANIFLDLEDLSKLKVMKIPWFVVKVLENDKIRLVVNKIRK